jgi:hypothetical protein
MFRSSTIIRELVLSLAKVILKHSVKLCPYRLCGPVWSRDPKSYAGGNVCYW